MPRLNQHKTRKLGIPDLAAKIRLEKPSEVVPVKLQHSLKKAVPQPRSEWIRNLIIKELTT